jgi:hypothetical protein
LDVSYYLGVWFILVSSATQKTRSIFNSAPWGCIPRGGGCTPHVSYSLGTGRRLGNRFPTSPFWGNTGRRRGCVSPVWGSRFPKRGASGHPPSKRELLDAPHRKGDSWASPLNFCLIRLKLKKRKQITKKLKTLHHIFTLG